MHSSSSLYVTDTLGDVESAKYGGASQRKVPRFRRRGAGVVLGLHRGLKIAPGRGDGHGIEVLPGGRKRVRYTESSFSKASSTSKGSTFKKTSGETETRSSLPEYLPFGHSHQGQTHADKAPEQYLGHLFAGTGGSDARNGKEMELDLSEGEKEGEEEGEEEEESDKDTVSLKDEIQERLRDLNSKIRADPSDATSWLALVAIQEDILAHAHDRDHDLGSSMPSRRTRERAAQFRQSVAEVQLAVVERAFREDRSNASSLSLIKAKLELAALSNTWTKEEMEKEWKKATDSVSFASSKWSASIDLWDGFLKWKLGNHSEEFVLQDALDTFAEALDSLRFQHLRATSSKGISQQKQEADLLDLFEGVVNVLLDAGFVERARGLLQAQTELCFHSDGTTESIESFHLACRDVEDYWDLQEYRVGEKGSQGWRIFREKLEKGDHSIWEQSLEKNDLVTFGSVPEGLKDADPITRWLALEQARVNLRVLPTKWSDEADWQTGELEVDPFSFVLFSDIAPFLIPIKTIEGKQRVSSLFLSSLNLPAGVFNSRHLLRSKHFWPAHLSMPSNSRTWEVIGGEMMSRPKASALGDPFKMPIKQWPASVDDIFAIQSDDVLLWFTAWERESGIDKKSLEIGATLLEQLSVSSTELSISQLALSAATQKHKATTRLAKQMLSRDRDNIDLWQAYARLERNHGNLDSARTVYKSLLMGPHSDPRPSLTCVWADWAELEWESGQHVLALHILKQAGASSFGSVEQVSIDEKTRQISSMDVLRTRRALRQSMTTHISDVDIVFCAALFQYLTDDKDEAFDSALKIFDEAIRSCNQGEVDEQAAEKFAMKHCKFIWRHVSGKSNTQRSRRYIPREITARLRDYVLVFPHNTVFVSLLAAFEMTTKVENVLRKVLEEKMTMGKTTTTTTTTTEDDWLVYIYCELHMNLDLINENAVRRLFERALDAKSLPLSSLLWQFYLRFETQISQRLATIAVESRQRFDTEPQQDQARRETLKERFKVDQRLSRIANLRAKAVMYRAIDKVPYCKALYLAAFSPPLRSAFTNDELLHLFHLMQERHIRYFTSLDAFLVEAPPSSSGSSSSTPLEGEGEEDHHHNTIE